MTEEDSVRVFDLVVKGGSLPSTLDKLVPLSFIGAAAVSFYRAKVKAMEQLGMAEDQRKATLADGQDAGDMLLDIEAKIGGLLRHAIPDTGTGGPPGQPRLKGEAAQMLGKHREQARLLARNPAAVEAVRKEARANEDIPTKTAVLNKIRAESAEAKVREFNRNKPKVSEKPELSEYLEECIEHATAVNAVLKEILQHPDQLESNRLRHFIGLVKRTVEILNTHGRGTAWKQIT